LSVHKTKVVVLTNKKGFVRPTFRLNGEEVQPKAHLWYLGVKLSRTQGFKTHLETIVTGAAKTVSARQESYQTLGVPNNVAGTF